MKHKLILVLVMLIFGSLGLFVKNINLSSSEIAFFRGAIGSIVIVLASIALKRKIQLKTSKKNIILLFLSGGAMGFNWIFLFEAYRYTTVSIATISYYFAPVIVLLFAPFVLKESWTLKKVISIVAAVIGLIFVVNPGGEPIVGNYNHPVGVGYGLLAASLYASVILINQFIKNISGIERTIIQLMVAAMVIFPYVLLTEGMKIATLNLNALILLLIVGIVHTGLAYILYFTALPKLTAQTVAVTSYIDPISAVLMSAFILNESMGLLQVIGGILILGSTFITDVQPTKSKKGNQPYLKES